jgi:hypothetical protein
MIRPEAIQRGLLFAMQAHAASTSSLTLSSGKGRSIFVKETAVRVGGRRKPRRAIPLDNMRYERTPLAPGGVEPWLIVPQVLPMCARCAADLHGRRWTMGASREGYMWQWQASAFWGGPPGCPPSGCRLCLAITASRWSSDVFWSMGAGSPDARCRRDSGSSAVRTGKQPARTWKIFDRERLRSTFQRL